MAAMDSEIEEVRGRLDQLIPARIQYAAAHRAADARGAPSPAHAPKEERSGPGTLTSLLLRLMADGVARHVDGAVEMVETAGRSTTQASVQQAFSRGAATNGPFERGPCWGTFRVRPEVIAGWPSSTTGSAA
jgi:hypothetical protein